MGSVAPTVLLKGLSYCCRRRESEYSVRLKGIVWAIYIGYRSISGLKRH